MMLYKTSSFGSLLYNSNIVVIIIMKYIQLVVYKILLSIKWNLIYYIYLYIM